MTTEIVNYAELLAGLAKKAASVEKPSTSTITAKAGILALNGTAAPGNKLDVIVIASTHANLYYTGAYDPKNIASPVCYAYSPDPDEIPMAPHPKSSDPQHTDCATCPKNQWGSDPKGGRGKACKNTRKIAAIPASTVEEDIRTAETAVMSLPVMSVANWGNYTNKLSQLFNLPPLAMRTQISTKPDQRSQFKVEFDDLGKVDMSLIPALLEKSKVAQPMLEREYEAAPAAPAETKNKKF